MSQPPERWAIAGPTGQPVRPGDKSLWLTLDTHPHELPPTVANRLGEALQMAGSRALSAAPEHGHGHLDPPHPSVIADVVMEE